MARWSGWGAGPAGAGSTGGPSRVFLTLALLVCAGVAAVLARDGSAGGAIVAAQREKFVVATISKALKKTRDENVGDSEKSIGSHM